MPTQIGNTTLSPGKYRVKITPATNGIGDSVVQFFRLYSQYGNDFNPPYDELLVLTVNASIVDLRAPAASTELVPASDDINKASALEIRGNSTEYIFGMKTASGE